MLNKNGVILILVLILVVTIGGFFYYRHTQKQFHQFKVTFFDIGQGDSTFIQFENGEQMLVDCGADRRVLARLGKAMPFYDRTIDYLMPTHPDLDHYGGCVDVLERYQVKKIIINGKKKDDDAYWREFDRAVGNEGAEIIVMASPTVWTIAGNTLEFISPDPALKLDVKADDSNNYSIVFRLIHRRQDRDAPAGRLYSDEGETTFLFTGDMELPLEKAVMNKYCSSTNDETRPHPTLSSLGGEGTTSSPPYPAAAGSRLFEIEAVRDKKEGIEGRSRFGCPTLRAEILKIGHHGSDSSTSEDFLAVVRPKQAVISAGKRNKYGHPSRRVLKRLERAEVEIFRTDTQGNIVMP